MCRAIGAMELLRPNDMYIIFDVLFCNRVKFNQIYCLCWLITCQMNYYVIILIKSVNHTYSVNTTDMIDWLYST